jgi:Domain of unknown function (DUF397)
MPGVIWGGPDDVVAGGETRAIPRSKEDGMVQVPQSPATMCWQKSKRSGEGACAQVARTHNHVWIRDSKSPGRPVLGFTRESWTVFILGVRHGDFRRA